MGTREKRQLEIFGKAVALPAEEREAYLDQACGPDEETRRAVDRLLKAHDSSGILDRPGSPMVELGKEQVRKAASGEIGGILEKPGDLLGQYLLRRLLGEGGFGAVFLADQQGAISRQVALKIIKPGMDTRPVIARFEAERQTLALMEHPCIAKAIYEPLTDSTLLTQHGQVVGTPEYMSPEQASTSGMDADIRSRYDSVASFGAIWTPWRWLSMPMARAERRLRLRKKPCNCCPPDGEVHRAELEEHLKKFRSAVKGST